MSTLSSDEIIAHALRRLGNETLTPDAQVWLLNILDRLYEDFKWPFLRKTTTGNLTGSPVALPTDFDCPWDKNSFKLFDSSGAVTRLLFLTEWDFDELQTPDITGTPRFALVDLALMEWIPYPLPSQDWTWSVRYKRKPARLAIYADFTPDFPNDEILVQAVFVHGLQHEDDDRYIPEMKMLMGMIATYQGKFNKQAQKSPRVAFSPKFSTPQSFR